VPAAEYIARHFEDGGGAQRLVLACIRKVVQVALERISNFDDTRGGSNIHGDAVELADKIGKGPLYLRRRVDVDGVGGRMSVVTTGSTGRVGNGEALAVAEDTVAACVCCSASVNSRIECMRLAAEVTDSGARQLPKTLCHTE
jgi:hypothetical protein